MKRNILLAILVTAGATTVSLAGAPAAQATVECRYAIQPGPGMELIPVLPPPPGPPPNQVLYVGGVTQAVPFQALYTAQLPRWSVVGLRSAPGTDYNLDVLDCDWGRRSVSVISSALVDFVAIDGNQPMPGRMLATVSNATQRVGTFALEYSTAGPALTPGSSQSLMMRGTPALVRDVYVAGGETAIISLRPSSGDSDLAVVTSASAYWFSSRAQAIQTSNQLGLVEDRVALTVPAGQPGRTFGLVVINNAPLSEAVLARH